MTTVADQSPEEFLAALRNIGKGHTPYTDSGLPNGPALDAIYGRFTTALADFVDAFRGIDEAGYWGAVTIAHEITHAFPASEKPEPIIARAQVILAKAQTAPEHTYPPKDQA